MDISMEINLKFILRPVIVYYGEWNLANNLESIAKIEKEKNKYVEFLNRYYYTPLNVIFKNDDMVRSFSCVICSKLETKGRALYFSKKEFLRSIIPNIDDVVDCNGDKAYKDIKKAIRLKKDMYRAVSKLQEDSEYYEDVKNEYNVCGNGLTFDEFVKMCKTKYTRLLNGYNTFLNLFDKPINVDRFVDCFNLDQLYLSVVSSLLKYNEGLFKRYNKVECNYKAIEDYVQTVNKIREKDNFYNSFIETSVNGEKKIYTVDDLISDYEKLKKKVGE